MSAAYEVLSMERSFSELSSNVVLKENYSVVYVPFCRKSLPLHPEDVVLIFSEHPIQFYRYVYFYPDYDTNKKVACYWAYIIL